MTTYDPVTLEAAARVAPLLCEICWQPLTWKHDHRADNSGLDDGPPLYLKRKKAGPKTAEEWQDIRSRAWATRRHRYGSAGHR